MLSIGLQPFFFRLDDFIMHKTNKTVMQDNFNVKSYQKIILHLNISETVQTYAKNIPCLVHSCPLHQYCKLAALYQKEFWGVLFLPGSQCTEILKTYVLQLQVINIKKRCSLIWLSTS